MAGFHINEPAVCDVIRALRHLLDHEADVQVSRAASSHHYGFSMPDVLQQRIDALSCEGKVDACGPANIASNRNIGFNMPRITGEVRVFGSNAESCTNFGSLIGDTPAGRRVRLSFPMFQYVIMLFGGCVCHYMMLQLCGV